MTVEDPASRGFSLKRWSQRKLEAARAAPAPASAAAPSAVKATGPAEATQSPQPSAMAQPPATSPSATAEEIAAPALPPIESLTIDSDFSAFLGPRVDPAIKLQALKRLFRDPRFNVMDGLDVYIDDYSIPDPLEPEVARALAHARYVFDPPRTRVNEAGIVEDVPPDEASIDASALPSDATTQSDATSLSDAPTAPDAPSSPGAESSSGAKSSSGAEPSSNGLPSAAPTDTRSASAANPVGSEGKAPERIEPTRR